MNKLSLLTFLDNMLVFLWGLFFLAFPLVLSTSLTDAFMLPKEILLGGLVLFSLLVWGLKMVITEKVTLTRTPFDVPVLLFLFALLLSSLFAVNRMDSLIAYVPILLCGIGFFIIVHVFHKPATLLYGITALLIGATATSIWAVFSYLHVYPLLFSYTHVPFFTPIGSLLEQAFFLIFLLPVAVSLALPIFKGNTNNKTVTFAAISLCLGAGLFVTIAQLTTTQKPVLLPFETGFQTAFAAISQDTGRIAQGFLFGSGYGNFATVFTRFKQASFNSTSFWANQFTNSSSFLLEILSTTGILGMLSYLFLAFRAVTKPKEKQKNYMYVSLVLLFIVSILLPFSFFEVSLLFILLGLFSIMQKKTDDEHYYDVELKFVTLKKGMISLQQISVPSHEKHEYNKPTAYISAGIILVFVVLVGWQAVNFVWSDMLFQTSLVLASGKNGSATYKDEAQAITIFPYRDVYYRIFSQTNISLAGDLANVQKKGTKPDTTTQNTIYTLLQQGINTGKQATLLSPQTVANWQNLSSVYRSLIGVGQNAETFAVQASQQAVVLDPTNPQEYIALGGLYYQLGQWDNAIQEFQQAVNLKTDYANAYYNLGHAYEQKGDYQNALNAYQAVQQLVANDKTSLATINSDINNVQAKLGSQGTSPTPKPVAKPTPATVQNQPLNLSGQVATPTPSPVPSPASLQ